MDFGETEEQTMLRRMVGKLAQEEVKPVQVEIDKKINPKDCFPWELLRKTSKLGLRTISVSGKYGGGDVEGLLSHITVIEELAAGDNGFTSSIRSCVALASWMDVLCNEQQKEEFFPKIVEDDTFDS